MSQCKITFLGDLTCDRRMLRAALGEDGKYDYSRSLAAVPETLKDSDCVIGNLETVFAGAKYGYNPWAVTYNSPDELLYALKDMGVQVMTTGNNHALDMGRKGLKRTISLMEELGIQHTGTFLNKNEKRYTVLDVNGIRIGLVAYTDKLNKRQVKVQPADRDLALVNYLEGYKPRSFKENMIAALAHVLPLTQHYEKEADKKRAAGVKLVTARQDNDFPDEQALKNVDGAVKMLDEARKESDFVVASIHSGGQFNGEPGTRSAEIYRIMKPHADVICGNHPHVVQKTEEYQTLEGKRGMLFYSLGGLNMSVGAQYVTHDFFPEFSLGVHMYLKKDEDGTTALEKITFTLYHIAEEESGYLIVTPVDHEGCNGDTEAMREVFRRVTGRDFTGFQAEYEL